jgi:hypothetical protein
VLQAVLLGTIAPPPTPLASTPTRAMSTPAEDGGDGIGTGAIVGIVLAAVAVMAAAAVLLAAILLRRRPRREKSEPFIESQVHRPFKFVCMALSMNCIVLAHLNPCARLL